MSEFHSAEKLYKIGSSLFQSIGAHKAEADLATHELVLSSMLGHDSHGIIRIPEYVGFIENGSLKTKAIVEKRMTGDTTAEVDCGQGFGAVGATAAINLGIEIARQHKTACVITRNCNHVGRLGSYVTKAAEAGMVAIATCNSPIYGHHVLPFGGREGRLATNPIAYGAPTEGNPIVADFSTSVVPEGKIRFYRNENKPVPDGWILDGEGKPTNDANDFYSDPPGGILPMGGNVGHKGYALGLLVEILGAVFSGISSTATNVFGNGVCFIILNTNSFTESNVFSKLMSETVEYMKSSIPIEGVEEVMVPGELEFQTKIEREKKGIPVDPETWKQIEELCKKYSISIED